jgi:hypothetical protein
MRFRLPLNSALPAKLSSARNLRASREPEQRVQYALHENHASARQVGIAVLGMLMFLVAALPAAHAQIVPVSPVHDATGDSKIPSGVVLAPLPHSELRRAVKPALPKSFFLLTAGVYAAGLDMQRSESMLPNFDERDPFVRPFLRLPAPAYYTSVALFCHGNQLSGMEDGAIRALAQDLVSSAGMLDGGKPGGIRIQAGASIAALMRRGAEIKFALDVRRD